MVKFKRQICKLYSGQIEWQILVAKSKQLKICIKICDKITHWVGGGGGGVQPIYKSNEAFLNSANYGNKRRNLMRNKILNTEVYLRLHI